MNNTENKISVTEAVRQFSDLINRVYYRGESVILTKGNKAVASIQPIQSEQNKQKKITVRELAEIFKSLPHLDPDDVDLFEKDIEEGKKMLLPPPENPWDS